MEEEKNSIVTTQEIEEQVVEKKSEEKEEEVPDFPALSAQDMAVLVFIIFDMCRVVNRFDGFVVLQIDSYPYDFTNFIVVSVPSLSDAIEEQLGTTDASNCWPTEIIDSI